MLMVPDDAVSLYEARVKEVPPLPPHLENVSLYPPEAHPLFPHLSAFTSTPKRIKKVGVVLSGGQAAGGHNVIIGLQKALQGELIGFLNGPAGIIKNQTRPLDASFVLPYLNTGGFDMIGSGRTKIETPEQFEAALTTVRAHHLDGLVIIGGDDSNTNAALLAEYFLAHNQPTTVVGVPKTIDGDLKNRYIEQPFGFDTAVKTYSEIVGNLLKDALSAKKYWYFIKLMGRSASHITLETALQTHPNLALISEEHKSLDTLVTDIVQLIEERARLGKNYGAILIPEGIAEFMALSGSYDPHGNLEVSKIESEKLLIDEVKKRLTLPFSPQALFFGYEGRSAFPSYFDAAYTYALGHVAAHLIAKGATGHMACLNHLQKPVSSWTASGAPLLNMLTMEMRHGTLKPVIAKSLVELNSEKYLRFKAQSASWRLDDAYRSPGPIQFWGPRSLVERPVF